VASRPEPFVSLTFYTEPVEGTVETNGPRSNRFSDLFARGWTITMNAAGGMAVSPLDHWPRSCPRVPPATLAELLVIRAGAGALGTPRLVACDLYVTLEPCPMCAQAISLARLRRLYYGAADPKSGAVDHGPRLFAASSCHHAPEVYGGIHERRAALLLKAFFRARRETP
jgi:tRNA(Arg) A34 adenosine deaminase TadA